jgi:hypothetical protein
MISLGNEIAYTGPQSTEYNLTWNSVLALYAPGGVLPKCAAYARSKGLIVVVPGCLDESPASAMQLQGAGYYPFSSLKAMAAEGATYISWHVYPLSLGGSTSEAITLIVETSAECGLKPLITECNPFYGLDGAPDYSQVSVWRSAFGNVPYLWWPYLSTPPLTLDVSSSGFWGALTGVAA